MVRGGRVKVLDFGIAKLRERPRRARTRRPIRA